jgi:hypothetical protein
MEHRPLVIGRAPLLAIACLQAASEGLPSSAEALHRRARPIVDECTHSLRKDDER